MCRRRHPFPAFLLTLACGAATLPATAWADEPGLRGSLGATEAPSYNWSGFYAGGSMGGASGATAQAIAVPVGPVEAAAVGAGGVRGMYAGMQGQWGSLVIGFEARLMGGAQPGRRNSDAAAILQSQDTDLIALVTPRLGYALDNTMFYVKGGFANLDASGSWKSAPMASAFGGGGRREDGWVVGAGMEHAISRWAAIGLDYSYVNVETKGRVAASPFVGPGAALFNNSARDGEIHTLMSKLTLLLGEGR